MTETGIVRVLETALLCADEPMPLTQLRKLFAAEDFSNDDLRRYLQVLQAAWSEKGLELVDLASGWRFQSRPEMQRFLARLNPEKPQKYSSAVLEDRKRVVEGKRVAVRLDLGGRRNIKKKNN